MPTSISSHKIAAILATFISVTTSSEVLERVLCIWYPVQFQEGQTKVQALIYSGSEVNAMTPAYAAQLGFTSHKTSAGVQKIDGSPPET